MLQDRKYYLLAVDDVDVNLFIIKQVFRDKNVEIHTAYNGSEAVEKLKLHIYDLVLMDIHMPQMSGIEATEIIRKKDSGVLDPMVPILAISADVYSETRDKAFQAGVNEYIFKPIKFEDLLINVAMLIQGRTGQVAVN